IFITHSQNEANPTPLTLNYTLIQDLDLTQFLGQTIRLRIASVNNQGRLIVGVDNVRIDATYADSSQPRIYNLRLRNPGFGVTPSFAGNTTDPTLIGQVIDDGLAPDVGSANNIKWVAFDVNGDGRFDGPEDFKTTSIDANGNFSFTIPNLLPGTYNMAAQVV